MRTEADTPVGDRYLWLDGFASEAAVSRVRAGLPSAIDPGTRVAFVGFAYADLTLPKRFDVAFVLDDPDKRADVAVSIVAATQQFGKPWSEIPHGWKTICVVDFKPESPAFVSAMDVVDAWYEARRRVGLCSTEDYPEVVRKALRTADQGR